MQYADATAHKVSGNIGLRILQLYLVHIMAASGSALPAVPVAADNATLSGAVMEEERKHIQRIANSFLYYK